MIVRFDKSIPQRRLCCVVAAEVRVGNFAPKAEEVQLQLQWL
jgi:hypothetical protein